MKGYIHYRFLKYANINLSNDLTDKTKKLNSISSQNKKSKANEAFKNKYLLVLCFK